MASLVTWQAIIKDVYVWCCECQNKNQTCCHLRWIYSQYVKKSRNRITLGYRKSFDRNIPFPFPTRKRKSEPFQSWWIMSYILCLMIINMINEWENMHIIYIKLLFKKLKNAVFLTLPIVYSLRYSNVYVAKFAGWLHNKLKMIM